VECDLTFLSLSYLCLPEISLDRTEAETEKASLRGYFAFHDYAVSCWVLHLQASISELKKESMMTDVTEILDTFLDYHKTNSETTHTVSKTWKDRLAPLVWCDFYKDLEQAVLFCKKQISPHGQGPSDDDTLDLPSITAKIRKALEGFQNQSLSSAEREGIKKYYGQNWFKCPRMNCQYFDKGFAMEKQRDHHVLRHERAFTCTFEGCPTTTFGCATAKELETHMFEYHGISNNEKLDFPMPSESTRKTSTLPPKFLCELCPKKFTRNSNLRAHSRTHSNERPYRCPTCDKGFHRPNDFKRHQETHLGKKKFACRGELNVGGSWGCGREFSRMDKLNDHWRSETGRICKLASLS
jgi:hypothetical protein